MRKALEDLIFIGKIEETFPLVGKKWTLKTITSEEQVEATSNTANLDNLARITALKIEILGFALTKVDDIELNDPEETVEFVKRLQTPLINALFTKYEELQAKQDEALTELDELKN